MSDDRKPLVNYHKIGHVAVFTLDAPPANTYSHEMMLDPLESGLTLERELQAKLFASGDAQEGIRSYNEKRRAEFEGS